MIRRLVAWRIELAVLVLAAVARGLIIATSSGGLRGMYGYDASVYYAAADALTHGLVPYRDFSLVHPPMIALALAPAALVGRLLHSDTSGFAAANLTALLVGAVNSALIVRVGRGLGLTVRAAAIGGLFYAVWFGAVEAEFQARLEPLGNFFFLAALLALLASRRRPGVRWLLLAGAMAGLACSVKVWWALPVALVVVWDAVASRSRTRPLALLGGLVLAGAVVDGPFFVLAPHRMWRMIVSSQLDRLRTHGSAVDRLSQMSSINMVATRTMHAGLLTPLVVVVSVLFLAACVAVWWLPGARVFVVLVLAQVATMLQAPSHFPFYADYIAVPVSVIVAALAHRLAGRERDPARTPVAWWSVTGPWARWVAAMIPVALAGAVTVSAYVSDQADFVTPFPDRHRLAHAAQQFRCVVSDSPMGQIELNALDRSFANGCPNQVDLTAGVLGVLDDRDKARPERFFALHWLSDLHAYLLSGDALIVIRRTGIGLTPNTVRDITACPVVAKSALYRLRDTRRCRP